MPNNSSKSIAVESAPAKKKSLFREYTEAILIALLIALFIRAFIIQAFKIPSGSMKSTLLVGDHILVSKFSYGIHIPNQIPFTGITLFPDHRFFPKPPKRGDIIVFKYPKNERKDFIKRVIGLPGDTIAIFNQKVYINGKPYDDPHAQHIDPVRGDPVPLRDNFGPVRVPEGHLFVMGDNRENSQDSRFWGFLDMDKVKGKALVIYWSWNKNGKLFDKIRLERLGKVLE